MWFNKFLKLFRLLILNKSSKLWLTGILTYMDIQWTLLQILKYYYVTYNALIILDFHNYIYVRWIKYSQCVAYCTLYNVQLHCNEPSLKLANLTRFWKTPSNFSSPLSLSLCVWVFVCSSNCVLVSWGEPSC